VIEAHGEFHGGLADASFIIREAPVVIPGANLVIIYRPISTLEWSDPCFAIRNAQTYGGARAATEANGGISRD
jgi:hypothetical protein